MKILKLLVLGLSVAAAFSALAQEATVTRLIQTDLGDLQDQEGVMLTVEYPPGASSAEHRHNAHTYVYVLEGSVIMQVAGGEKQKLVPGQTFYETPDDVHVVSRNASASEPARILVFFIKGRSAPATVPAS